MAPLSKTLAALTLLATTSLSSSALADTYHHIDELALAISQQTKELVYETNRYRHSPEFPHLLSDTRELARLADHMHEVAHLQGSIEHLEADLATLDATFHHFESVFARVEQGASWGYGHVHGSSWNVRRLLSGIENNIHHLQEDVRTLRASVYRIPSGVNRPAVGWDRYQTTPRHGGWGYRPYRARTFSIGGGSSQFTFRF